MLKDECDLDAKVVHDRFSELRLKGLSISDSAFAF
jgi:hypothetical protein